MFIQLITTKQHFGHHLKLSLREAAINTLMCTLIQFALWSTNLCLCWNSQFASLLGGKWYCQNRIIYSTLRGASETFVNHKNDVMVQSSQKFHFLKLFMLLLSKECIKNNVTFSSPSSFRLMMSRSKSVRRPVVLLNDSLPVRPSQWDWKIIQLYSSFWSFGKLNIRDDTAQRSQRSPSSMIPQYLKTSIDTFTGNKQKPLLHPCSSSNGGSHLSSTVPLFIHLVLCRTWNSLWRWGDSVYSYLFFGQLWVRFLIVYQCHLYSVTDWCRR